MNEMGGTGNKAASQLVLRHCIQRGGTEVPSNKDVTSLDWNVSLHPALYQCDQELTSPCIDGVALHTSH